VPTPPVGPPPSPTIFIPSGAVGLGVAPTPVGFTEVDALAYIVLTMGPQHWSRVVMKSNATCRTQGQHRHRYEPWAQSANNLSNGCSQQSNVESLHRTFRLRHDSTRKRFELITGEDSEPGA
jgi:hypothetical protein